MRPFIFKNLKTVQNLLPKDRFENEADIDVGDFPYLFREYWHDVFKHRFDSDRDVRSAVGLITEARNKVSHPEAEDLTSGYALARLHDIADILGQVNAPEQKREVEAIRDKLLTSAAPTVEAKPKLPRRKASDLTPWRDVIRPNTDVIEGSFRKSEFAADLQEVFELESEPSDSDIDHKERQSETTVTNKWTVTRVRDLLSEEVRAYHEKHFPEDRRNLFYRRVAEIQNLVEAEGWRLNPPKFNKGSCSFFLTDKGATRVRRTFGICLQPFLPHARPVGRNGEKIPTHSLTSNPPRVFAKITEEEARHLERQYRCEFSCVTRNQVYYNIPDDVKELLPVLEFAYNKHRGK